MNNKLLIVLALAVAVVAAGVSAVLCYDRRAVVARSAAERAASEEETASAKLKAAKAEAEKAASEAAKAAAEKESSANRLKAEKEQKERAKIEGENLILKKKIAEAEAATAKAKAKEAEDLRAAETAKAKAAKDAKDEAVAKAKTAEREAAKAESQRAKAEAETLKLRHSLAEIEQIKATYDGLMAELAEEQRACEELRRAYTPDKTVADLIILDAEDEAFQTNAVAKPAVALNPGERALADWQVQRDESRAARRQRCRDEIVAALEGLLKKAVAENRIIDATFYEKSIKNLYPDWTLTVEENKK